MSRASRALRTHLRHCGFCMTTDPASLCETGEALLEAAGMELVPDDLHSRDNSLSRRVRFIKEHIASCPVCGLTLNAAGLPARLCAWAWVEVKEVSYLYSAITKPAEL